MPATYMRRMRNNNLEIRIAGSPCRPQLVTRVDPPGANTSRKRPATIQNTIFFQSNPSLRKQPFPLAPDVFALKYVLKLIFSQMYL